MIKNQLMQKQGDIFQTNYPKVSKLTKPSPVDPQIREDWKRVLLDEFSKDYFIGIKDFLVNEKKIGKVIYPPGQLIFNAFNLAPFEKVKVVILGQDPYHGKGQAHGLCFSVSDGIAMPPSLVNIFKEIQADLGMRIPLKGNLESWAEQGVFLLNAILTVQAGQPASHSQIGWQEFTDRVIGRLSELRSGLVFMLWGKFAQGKTTLIDHQKHLVLTAPHPSPYSANSGFFGCKHFSLANKYLIERGSEPIDWSI